RPFIPSSRWVSALEAAGFVDVATGRDETEVDFGLDLVLARAGTPSATECSRSLTIAAAALSAAALRSYLCRRLPAYMIPADIVLVERFPLNPNGKVDRRALPKPQLPSASDAHAVSATALQLQLRDTWSIALNRDSIGLDDNFFELGGDSLIAVRIVADVR